MFSHSSSQQGKAEQTEKQWLFLAQSANWDHKANPTSIWRNGQVERSTARSAYWEQKLLERGTGRNTGGNFVELWRLNEELESSKFLGTQSRGGGTVVSPYCLEVYLQNSYQILTVTVRKRAPHVSVPTETCCNKVWSGEKEERKKRIQKHFWRTQPRDQPS